MICKALECLMPERWAVVKEISLPVQRGVTRLNGLAQTLAGTRESCNLISIVWPRGDGLPGMLEPCRLRM